MKPSGLHSTLRIVLFYTLFGGLWIAVSDRILEALAQATAAILVGYWLLLAFVPVPGRQSPSFAEGENLANHVDALYLPLHKWDGDHDPEGLLSTLPAAASCLLGVLCGMLLRSGSIGPYRKVLALCVAGALGVGLGFAWRMHFPVIKKIWTSSFVLVAGGYSALLLGLLYLVLDVWKRRRWAAPPRSRT